jgi:predicted DNA binding protein
VWRIVSSEKFAVTSPRVIDEEWTIDDVFDAHVVLDTFEAAEREAAKRAKQKR